MKFILKHSQDVKPQSVKLNNTSKKEVVMTNNDKLSMAESIINDTPAVNTVKRIKKDKGLIERTESSKTILTEDNKQLLVD